MPTLITARAPLSIVVRDQATSLDLPPWMRVALWCWANADEHGHARAYPGQLDRALVIGGLDATSRAVRIARERRLVDVCSTSACLVLPGHALAPCDARHRGHQ